MKELLDAAILRATTELRKRDYNIPDPDELAWTDRTLGAGIALSNTWFPYNNNYALHYTFQVSAVMRKNSLTPSALVHYNLLIKGKGDTQPSLLAEGKFDITLSESDDTT